METLSFLLYPFLACLLLILIHAYFGIHILERGIIFVDLALAQFIGIGIAISFLLGEDGSYTLPLVFAVIGAAVLSLSRKVAGLVNVEAFIGVIYIFSVSAAILILDRSPHGMEEFKAILNGNILWVTPHELLITLVIYSAVGLLHLLLWKRFIALSYEGKGGLLMEFLFFLSFAVVLVKSVQLAGILQVFSFLVLPALISRLYFRKPLRILLFGWLIGVATSVLGIFLSYRLDLPTAPLIVTSLALTFFVLLLLKAGTRNLGKPVHPPQTLESVPDNHSGTDLAE
jgi:zinc/manganese transport system permease protein